MDPAAGRRDRGPIARRLNSFVRIRSQARQTHMGIHLARNESDSGMITRFLRILAFSRKYISSSLLCRLTSREYDYTIARPDTLFIGQCLPAAYRKNSGLERVRRIPCKDWRAHKDSKLGPADSEVLLGHCRADSVLRIDKVPEAHLSTLAEHHVGVPLVIAVVRNHPQHEFLVRNAGCVL